MALERLLRPGERLLWSGQPDPHVRFTSADKLLVPFSVMWAGFTVVWESTAVAGGAPFFFDLWGIPFVAMGFYFTIGRFIWKARRKRQTAYLLTDQRATVVTGANQIAETPWRGLPKQITRHRDGQHVDVIFDLTPQGRWPLSRQTAMYANTGMDFLARRSLGVAFFDVADVDGLLAAMGQALP